MLRQRWSRPRRSSSRMQRLRQARAGVARARSPRACCDRATSIGSSFTSSSRRCRDRCRWERAMASKVAYAGARCRRGSSGGSSMSGSFASAHSPGHRCRANLSSRSCGWCSGGRAGDRHRTCQWLTERSMCYPARSRSQARFARIGDIIVTSGTGGLYPPNVADRARSSGSTNDGAIALPLADPGRITPFAHGPQRPYRGRGACALQRGGVAPEGASREWEQSRKIASPRSICRCAPDANMNRALPANPRRSRCWQSAISVDRHGVDGHGGAADRVTTQRLVAPMRASSC